MKRTHLLTASLVVLILFAGGAHAANLDAQNYRRAFALLKEGHAEQAEVFARRGRDPALNKVLRAEYMAQPGNDVSFEDMAAFISDNPDWPEQRGILMIAEQKMPTAMSATQVVRWFTAHNPVTLIGFYRWVDALDSLGQTQAIPQLVKARWVDGSFSSEELAAFASRFPQFLDRETRWARLDRLLWKNDIAGARHLYPYVGEDMKAVAEARMALANQSRDVAARVARVPDAWQNDAGLQYERLRWRRKFNHDTEAVDILLHPPAVLGKPEVWWDERHILLRRALDRGNNDLAYRLAAGHGLTEGKSFLQAEFLSGWIALRFLKSPELALSHFQALKDNATMPSSRARAAYWLGRTYEELGRKDEAEQAYEDAAAINMTYYGQLAMTRLYAQPVLSILPEPPIPDPVRKAFYERDLIRAIEKLAELKETDRVRLYFNAAVESAFQRVDFVLLMELAGKIGRPDFTIEAAKAANQKNMMVSSGGFPLLLTQPPAPPEPAFTHALIRQESMFNAQAKSPVGANGLMQLMPPTAKAVAHQLKMKFALSRMNDVGYNLKLGTTYIEDQIDRFDGSYVLALASYNAGPGRVREWMGVYGDPRRTDVDVVDWVERLPSPETRNYVQRIMENLQIYRAKLNGGHTPLMILKDLHR